jgi:hypothetical protein
MTQAHIAKQQGAMESMRAGILLMLPDSQAVSTWRMMEDNSSAANFAT